MARTATTRSRSAAGPARADSSSAWATPSGAATTSIMAKWPRRMLIDVSSRLHPCSRKAPVTAATMPGRSAPTADTANCAATPGPSRREQLQLAEAADGVVARGQTAAAPEGEVAVVGPIEEPRFADGPEELGFVGVVLDRRAHAEAPSDGGLGAHGRVVHGVELEPVGDEPPPGDRGQMVGPGGDAHDAPTGVTEGSHREAGPVVREGLLVERGIGERLVQEGREPG